MSAEYVRRYYGVDFQRGDRIELLDHLLRPTGRTGRIVSFPNQYLGVRFDGERHTSRVHAKEARRIVDGEQDGDDRG